MTAHARTALAILLLALTACSAQGGGAPSSPGPAAPGHGGPVPSPEAQQLLGELAGRTYVDEAGTLGGGELVVGAFGVVPNPVTGKGPVLILVQDGATPGPARYSGESQGRDGRYWLPVTRDADVADFYGRVTGEPPAGVEAGELSDDYTTTIGDGC